MKKYLLLLTVIIAIVTTSCTKSNININDYLNSGEIIDEYAKGFMPNIDEFLEYKKIHYQHDNIPYFIFESNSMTLVVEYDEDIYMKEKGKVLKEYKFLEDGIPKGYAQPFIPESEFSINSYDFKVVEDAEYDYPKSFGMIATSDEKNSIAYLYFHDLDIDYIISEDKQSPMADFVQSNFKYNF